MFLPSCSYSSQQWTEYPGVPILSGNGLWEGNSIQEADIVTKSTGALLMLYQGDGGTACLGTASSTDGITWTKNPSNPMIGCGASGVSGVATHASIYKEGSTMYVFYVDHNTTGNLWRIQSSDDGATWTNNTEVITVAQLPSPGVGLTNSQVIKVGSTYYLFEELTAGSFKIYLATSTDLTNWTFNPTQLSSLNIGGTSSGPNVHIIGTNNYVIWYHAGPTIPTDIYYATSTDLINWTQSNGVIINRDDEINLGEFPGGVIDQTADACVIELNGRTFIYYERVYNGGPFVSNEAMRMYNGTINDIVGGIRFKSKSFGSAKVVNASLK